MSALSFLGLKSFHPSTKANQRRLWIAEQKEEEKQRRKEEYKKRLLEQQELFETKKIEEQKKQNNLQDLETMKKRKHQLVAGNEDQEADSSVAPAKKKRKRSKKNKNKNKDQQNANENENSEKEGSGADEANHPDVYGPTMPSENKDEKSNQEFVSEKENAQQKEENSAENSEKKETQPKTEKNENKANQKKKPSFGPNPNSVAAVLSQLTSSKPPKNENSNVASSASASASASPFISVKKGENISQFISPSNPAETKMKTSRLAQFPEKPPQELAAEIEFIEQDKSGIPKPLTFVPQQSKKPEEMFTYIPKKNFTLTEKFPFLKNAPKQGRYVDSVSAKHQPFGIALRDVRCTRCGGFGHGAGDRECPYRDVNPLDFERRKLEDPLAGHESVKKEGFEQLLQNLSEEDKELLLQSLTKEKKKFTKGGDITLQGNASEA